MNICKYIKYYILKLKLNFLYFIKKLNTINSIYSKKKPNIYMALSCILLGIPGIYAVYNKEYSIGIFSILLVIGSLHNDYFGIYYKKFSLRYSALLTDQLCICIYFISLFLLYIKKGLYYHILFNIIIFICIYYIILVNFSHLSKCKTEWVYRHIIWHIIIFLYLFYIIHISISGDNSMFLFKYITDYLGLLSIIIVIGTCTYILLTYTNILNKLLYNKCLNSKKSKSIIKL